MRASRMRLGALAAAAGLILAIVLFLTVLRSPAERPTAEPARRTTPATRFFGVTVERTVLDGRLPPAAVLRAVRGNGAGVISLPFTWSTVQPTPARRYDWGFDDRAVAAAAQAGLDVQAVLAQAPGWARRRPGEPWSPPRSPGAFAAWAGAAAARYGTRRHVLARAPRRPEAPDPRVAGLERARRREHGGRSQRVLGRRPARAARLRGPAPRDRAGPAPGRPRGAGRPRGPDRAQLGDAADPVPGRRAGILRRASRCTRTPGAPPTSSASSGSSAASCATTATAASPSW